MSNVGMRYSAPCSHCADIIKKIGIKKIVYSNHEGNFEMYKTRDYNTNFKTSGTRYINIHKN